MQIHPAANMFPLMSEDDYTSLRKDIDTNGQKDPIRVWRDMLIDGRHRKRACDELQISCLEDKLPDRYTESDILDLIVSLNIHRRHLTASQKAAIAVELLPMYESASKTRQSHGMTAPGKSLTPILEEVSEGSEVRLTRESTAQAAKATGASRSYVAEAKALKVANPEAFEAVKQGDVSLSKARAESKPKKADLPTVQEAIAAAGPPDTWPEHVKAQLDANAVPHMTRNIRDALAPFEACLFAMKGEERKAMIWWGRHTLDRADQ